VDHNTTYVTTSIPFVNALPHVGFALGSRDCLDGWLSELYAVAYWLGPFLPDASGKIKATVTTGKVRKVRPLFPRGVRSGKPANP